MADYPQKILSSKLVQQLKVILWLLFYGRGLIIYAQSRTHGLSIYLLCQGQDEYILGHLTHQFVDEHWTIC